MKIHLWQHKMLDVKNHRLLFSKKDIPLIVDEHKQKSYESRMIGGYIWRKRSYHGMNFFHSIKM
ncbi:hypothetical protein COJ50_05100 [Bacillus cereus]|uniref:Uncharacterized protein n=1 Tax=Bacillus cereus TaxID=1396 RepID=A0A2B1KRB0_BACCE|nr:hypothetical protein COJ50_05100 [Bacillus cereus]